MLSKFRIWIPRSGSTTPFVDSQFFSLELENEFVTITRSVVSLIGIVQESYLVVVRYGTVICITRTKA